MQKLKSTLKMPGTPTLSSQKTTQTSSFFPVRYTPTADQNRKELQDVRNRFRTIIEEQTAVIPAKQQPNSPINLSTTPKKKSLTKKLSFLELKKPGKSEDGPATMNLSKAQELKIRLNERLSIPVNSLGLSIEDSGLLRSPCRSKTFRAIKNPVQKHTKHASLAMGNEYFTSRLTPTKRKKWQSQSHFLKTIVRIDRPKFEAKVDFLNKKDLRKHEKTFMFSQAILQFIRSQCKASDNGLNVYKFVEICKDNYTHILQLFPLVRQAINAVKNRSEFDKVFHEIEGKCQQSRNMALTIKSLLLHAKVLLRLQDVYKAIIIYKNCKKLAISCQLYHYLINCYKGLGRCFQCLKQYQLALAYFSKMLQASWKLEDKDHEVLAYDLIGMQYYYLGDLERSKYYHRRMVDGELEPRSSNVRVLAVQQFLQKKSKTAAKDPAKQVENPLSQFTENLLDSSNEAFQLPNPTNSRRSEPDIRVPKATILGRNLTAIREKSRKERLIGSMRTTEEFKRLLNLNLVKGNKKTGNTYVGEKQEKVLVSHLSPNRELIHYQMYKPSGIRNINFYNINDYLYENESVALGNRIREMLKKYAERLLATINKLKAIFGKAG